jgi:exonuclease III
MTTFLFWNLKHKSLERYISNLARQHQADVLMFAEYEMLSGSLLHALNENEPNLYYEVPVLGCNKIRIFTRFDPIQIPALYEEDRLTVRHLKIPNAIDILLAIVHFPSKKYWKETSQNAESTELGRAIREEEQKIGHDRTILVGDLNMNPFEAGMVNANSLHGVMSRKIAQKGNRLVNRRTYPFFYNPMWSLLGDATAGPPGTYYYANAEHNNTYWNMFDQILIRPSLLSRFNNNDLKILISDGERSLLSSNDVPDSKNASDHLPLVFKLTL